MKDISLRKNFLLTLLGNFAYGGAQWAMLMVIAKFGTPEMLGRFVLATAVTAPVVTFAELKLRSVLATDAHGRYEFGEYLALRLLMLAGALAFIFFFAVAAKYDREMALVIALVGLAKAIESVSDIFFGLMQRHERMARVAMSLLFKGSLSLALFALGVYFSRSLLCAAFCLLASWILSLVVYDIWNARRSFGGETPRPSFLPSWSKPRLKALMVTALPLGMASLLDTLQVNIPRYFVAGMLGARGLGFFAAMAYVPIVGARVINALGNSAVPRLARYHQDGEAASYRVLLLKIILFGCALGALALLVVVVDGKKILTVFYRPEYAERLDAFVWIMIAAGLTYVSLFMEYGLLAAQRFWVQPAVVASSCLVLALACAALIPRFGIAGAAMAMAAGASAQAVGNSYITWRILRELRAAEAR